MLFRSSFLLFFYIKSVPICSQPNVSALSTIRDRKSVVKGKSVELCVDLGGRRIIKKKNYLSGRSISFFHRNLDGIFENVETGELLSDTWLIRYFKNNFVVQKAMKQSAFMSRLCKTSVNTLRVAVYRSVITNKSDVINTIIRMGKDGSLVDKLIISCRARIKNVSI